MTSHTPTRAPLVRSELQRLTQVKVSGQKLRYRNWRTFPAMTAKLVSETAALMQGKAR